MSVIRRIAIVKSLLDTRIEGLRHLLDAIAKWRNVAHQELADWGKRLEDKKEASEYDCDILVDEAYMTTKTERLMYANVSVSLFAVAENVLRVLCLNLDGTEVHKQIKSRNKPNWGHIRNALQKHFHIEYHELEHYETMVRVRLLNNCFKHSSGNPNAEFMREYGGDYIEGIEYEKEDWNEIISNCHLFLHNLANKINDAVKIDQQ